eukprot:m.114283 g.114283  ORF g.114283 m.114283 type:complete len:464 (+) comp13048_c0_seq1:1681-3072(+)
MERRLSDGVVRHAAGSLTAEEAAAIYARDQLLWMQLPASTAHPQSLPAKGSKRCKRPSDPAAEGAARPRLLGASVEPALAELYARHPAAYTPKFHVENAAGSDAAQLTAPACFDPPSEGEGGRKGGSSGARGRARAAAAALAPPPRFYVSTILNNVDSAVDDFLSAAPSPPAGLFADATYDDGLWLFVGRNPCRSSADDGAPAPPSEATGTHDQGLDNGGAKNGRRHGKRRRVEAASGNKSDAPSTNDEEGEALAGRAEHTDDVDHTGTWHIQLCGTKTWELRPATDAPVWGDTPPTLTPKLPGAVKARGGRVVLRLVVEEGDLLMVNTRAWWHKTEIAPQRSFKGLSVSFARDWYDGALPPPPAPGGEKRNDCELDPRLYAPCDLDEGDIALDSADVPESLPRATDPNCEVVGAEVDGEVEVVLMALRPIAEGEPLTVAPDSDGEYEEVEVDLETGELVRLE